MPFMNRTFQPAPSLYGNRYKPAGFIPPVAPPIPVSRLETGAPYQPVGQAPAPEPVAPMGEPPRVEDPSGSHRERQEQYDINRRKATAEKFGYAPGQGNLSGALGILGMAAGIPGVGFITNKLEETGAFGNPEEPRTITREDGSTYTDHRSQKLGEVGTYDSQGNVFGNDGRAYDPITGRPRASYRSTDDALGHIFGDQSTPPPSQAARDLGVSEGSMAGIRTQKGEDSIQQLLDDVAVQNQKDAAVGSLDAAMSYPTEIPKPTTATGGTDLRGMSITQTDDAGARPSEVIGQTSGGDDVYAPTGGGTVVTDRHGNAVTSTNRQGQKVAVTSPDRDDNDSGGGGGGGK